MIVDLKAMFLFWNADPDMKSLKQGFGSASISCGSGSRVLKTYADPDPDTDPDPRPEFLRVKKYLKISCTFFQAFLQL